MSQDQEHPAPDVLALTLARALWLACSRDSKLPAELARFYSIDVEALHALAAGAAEHDGRALCAVCAHEDEHQRRPGSSHTRADAREHAIGARLYFGRYLVRTAHRTWEPWTEELDALFVEEIEDREHEAAEARHAPKAKVTILASGWRRTPGQDRAHLYTRSSVSSCGRSTASESTMGDLTTERCKLCERSAKVDARARRFEP